MLLRQLVKRMSETFGMDTAIILLNTRLDEVRSPSL